MKTQPLNVLLADDDIDDCLFFKQALTESMLDAHLTTVHDGEQLMDIIKRDEALVPYIIFLDLNMPRKNGLECLVEIKLNPHLKAITIVILSTSFEQAVVNQLYDHGAHYFIRKPVEFSQFKKIIKQTFGKLLSANNHLQPLRENFVLTLQNSLAI